MGTSENSNSRSPLRGNGRTHQRIIIAHHLVLHGYGQWLPNDPRGSGSDEIREHKLDDLGEIHFGRKRVRPPRTEIREFYRQAEPLLDFPTLWLDHAKRQAIGDAFSQVIAVQRYTVWGCAVMKNHAHLLVRRHRDDARSMWSHFANQSRAALREFADVSDDHPIWSNRPYAVFLYTPEDVRRVVSYIAQNPAKEGLPPQSWPFVRAYDGWPFREKGR